MEELFSNVALGRVIGIKRDAESFRAEVRQVAGQVAPELLEIGVTPATEELHARLTRTQQDDATLKTLDRQIKEKEKYIKETAQTIEVSKGRLAALCRQAGCSDYQELDGLERVSREYQELQKNLAPWNHRSLETALQEQESSRYVLRLYVAGLNRKSIRAIENLKKICGEHLQGRYELEVIDIYQQPVLAQAEQIIAVPTLIKQLPTPLRRFIGDMSQAEKILVGLDLRPPK